MARDIEFSPKLQPLFRPKTRYTLLIGGRGGGKSFAMAAAIALSTYDDGFNVLFARFTMVSAEVSVIPEFQEKLQLLNAEDDFYVTKRDVVNKGTGARIFFRGFKTGSKSQTAHLKSLHKIKTFVMDEAEELVDEKEFDSVDDSLREKEAEIHVFLVLNQADVSHWIYKRFYEVPGLPDDFCGVHGDVTYIPITYLDNIDNLDETFLAKVRKMQEQDPEKYEHVYGLKWARQKAGLIYTRWTRDSMAELMTRKPDSWYGIDWGFTNDPTAIVRIWYDHDTGIVWAWPIVYRKGMLTGQIAKAVRNDMLAVNDEYIHTVPEWIKQIENPEKRRIAAAEEVKRRTEEVVGWYLLYCDPARPEHIQEFRMTYGLNAAPGDNRNKSSRVDWLKGCDVHYDGDDMHQEVGAYSYLPSRLDPNLFSNDPQDGNDHALDALNYGVVTHLRRQGIPNALGEV